MQQMPRTIEIIEAQILVAESKTKTQNLRLSETSLVSLRNSNSSFEDDS